MRTQFVHLSNFRVLEDLVQPHAVFAVFQAVAFDLDDAVDVLDETRFRARAGRAVKGFELHALVLAVLGIGLLGRNAQVEDTHTGIGLPCDVEVLGLNVDASAGDPGVVAAGHHDLVEQAVAAEFAVLDQFLTLVRK